MVVDKKTINKFRRVLKVFGEDMYPMSENFQTDQQKKVPNPPLQKPYPKDGKIVDLIPIEEITVGKETTLH